VGLEALRDGRDADAAAQSSLREMEALLICSEPSEADVQITGTAIKVSLRTRMEFPFGGMFEGAVDDRWEICGEAKVSAEYPVEQIRRLRLAKKISEGNRTEE